MQRVRLDLIYYVNIVDIQNLYRPGPKKKGLEEFKRENILKVVPI